MIPHGNGPSVGAKLVWAIRMYWTWVVVLAQIRRTPLPDLIREMRVPRRSSPTWTPRRTAANVTRLLRVGNHRARCLISSIVGLRMLSMAGYEAEVVIGLPNDATDHSAHAWLEVDGRDISPPPGRGDHVEIARY
jgi:hypothetical protein